MFSELLRFEIKNRLWRISSLVYFLVFLLCSFLISITFAGAFPGANLSLGSSNKLSLNSPVMLHMLISFGGYFGLLIIAPIFGQSINKDFETHFSQILFATPLRKSTYFFVRYLGSFISSAAILTSIAIGNYIATLMPFVDRTLIGKNHLWFYVVPYLNNIVPNTMIFGAVFIAVVSLFKRMAPVYLVSILFFTGWLIAKTLSANQANETLSALLDPLGLVAAESLIRHWSVIQQSTQTIPLSDIFLYNRLLWAGIGCAFLLAAFKIFNPFNLARERQTKPIETADPSPSKFAELSLPETALAPHSFGVFSGLTLSEFKLALSNIHFQMILLCGVLFILFTARDVGKLYGTETLPVTCNVLQVINGSFTLFVLILTTFCAGELVWKEREQQFSELVDSKPVSNVHLYLSQLLTLFLIQVLLSIVVLICCVTVQICMGYFNFEWGVYFQNLFVFSLVPWLFMGVLALFVHSLAKQKYIGHSILILYYVLLSLLPSLGFDHHIYLVGDIPSATYSDMNGFGTSGYPFCVYSLYWGLYALTVGILTVLSWPRGSEQTYKSRLRELRRRISPLPRIGLAVTSSGFVIVGAFIFYNTNILNKYETKADVEKHHVDYELKFKRFERTPQPELIAANVEADIFPEAQTLKARGRLTYRNKTQTPIATVLVNQDTDLRTEKLNWSRPVKVSLDNKTLGVTEYEFEEPLAPSEEVSLDFASSREPHGFSNDEFDKKIVQNGSFFYGPDLGPVIGYIPQLELSEDKVRRKYGLREKLRTPDVNDKEALQKTYISNEGSWINFEATVSTSADQIAIAPGYLTKEWKEGGRHYFHYKMDCPMLNFYAILSGNYKVARDKWHDVNIEVYYHPGHPYNIERMIKAVKASLDYYTKNFSPYQFKQLRIIEFPRYKQMAQSFANTIPFSESMGFIANVKDNDPNGIDYPFYVTSHEVAHQWWAHQVIGANVQGATMLSESIAQYSALMVQEKEYGAEWMRKFLEYELDNYLSGRRTEAKKELPLALNEGQPYIHYNKGGLVFYTLKDYLGEEAVNRVLRDYIHDVAFQQPPFTRAVDLVERFRQAAPKDKKYLIEDLFDTITFYDNRTESVQYHKTGGHFDVVVHGSVRKLRADGLGKETEIPMNDLVDIGLWDKSGKILHLQKHSLKNGNVDIHIVLKSPPFWGGIDPMNKLPDKGSGDNWKYATECK